MAQKVSEAGEVRRQCCYLCDKFVKVAEASGSYWDNQTKETIYTMEDGIIKLHATVYIKSRD